MLRMETQISMQSVTSFRSRQLIAENVPDARRLVSRLLRGDGLIESPDESKCLV